AGLVLELYPGVFALAGAPPCFEQQVLALCLSVNGFASHRCAAYLWGFRKFERQTVEVLTRRTHTPSVDDATVRRTRRLVTCDVDTCRGLPITSRARTLLDLCDVSPQLAEGALNGALHKRQVTVLKLQVALNGVAPQHPGAARFRHLLRPFSAGQRPTGSELEDDFLDLVVRRYNLPVPVRQHPVGRRSIDFAYPELIFGIEIDSVRGHAAREDVDRNASKANELLDWWIARFVYNDIHRWPEDTAAFLVETIARRRSLFAA
ncbi:MAG TPA: hypothetical protein VJS45_09030, partial [Acidimicrobiia bacterium]|nr:hypothetical protein [Acidimicrobiia bacterium]